MGFLSGVAGAIGGIASTILGNNSAKDEAQKNREWQEQMSNTSISRRMADLRNAGLNPLLAVDNASSGASTPAGSQAQIERFNPEWLTALSSAKVANAQARQIDEQTKAIKQENSIFDVKADKLRTEAELQRQNILNAKTIRALNEAQTLDAKANVLVKQAQRENVKMSTEEAKRKIQLLDFEVGVYDRNPDLKEREKRGEIWKGMPGSGAAGNVEYFGNRVGAAVGRFLDNGWNSAKRFWSESRKNRERRNYNK